MTPGIIGAVILPIIGDTIIIGIHGITDRGGAFILRVLPIMAPYTTAEDHRMLTEDRATDMEEEEGLELPVPLHATLALISQVRINMKAVPEHRATRLQEMIKIPVRNLESLPRDLPEVSVHRKEAVSLAQTADNPLPIRRRVHSVTHHLTAHLPAEVAAEVSEVEAEEVGDKRKINVL